MDFAARLIAWQALHGRHDLPWQHPRDPYRVWLSEIMLQQTQVATVRGYFERFIARFPDVARLAAASEDDVLALWSGLGYYSRARNLHLTAQRLVAEQGGRFPDDPAILATLPGIGRSTAAAIAALAFDRRAAILDGNVKRVLARHAGIAGWPGEKAVENRLWQEAQARLPLSGCAQYTQALMDLGALVCTPRTPACPRCPVASDCVARETAQTATLPTPRPRRSLPTRTVHWLVLHDARRVLLVKRPQHGIWGGLWSLPEAPTEATLADCVHSAVGHLLPEPQPLAPLTHGFTHFRLDIRPAVCALSVLPEPADPSFAPQPWGSLPALGLPSPVRRLLNRLAPSPD